MLNPSHNKRQVKKFGLSILLFLLFLIPPLSQAAIREITLFPNSARIDETMKIQAQGSPASKNQVSIVLPSQADVETLMVTLPSTSKVKIEDIAVKSSHRVDENRIAQLRGQIRNGGKDPRAGCANSILAGADQSENKDRP